MSDTSAGNYPLQAYRYRVTIDDGDKCPTLSFSEVTGLSREYETVIYKDGLSFMLGYTIIPGELKPIRLTLKRGVFADDEYLDEWFDSMEQWLVYRQKTRDVTIALCDGSGKALVSWKVKEAIPIRLAAPELVASSNAVAIASLDLLAKAVEVKFGKTT